MVGVNLLPRGVLERRRFERWYRYIFIGFFGLLGLLAIAYVGLALSVQQKTDQVQLAQEDIQKYQAQANAIAVFEQNASDLQKRQALVQTALANRVNMGKLANDISLVLPDEVWLDSLTLNQVNGITLVANTPRSTSESMDVAYKSIAKTMVRLGELDGISGTWLSSAANSTWGKWTVAAGDPTPEPASVVAFQLTSKIVISKVSVESATMSKTAQ